METLISYLNENNIEINTTVKELLKTLIEYVFKANKENLIEIF